MLYNWAPNKHGILRLQRPDLPPDFLSLQTETNIQPVPVSKHDEGTRYLGLYITVDRNTKPMEQHLWKKALIYTTAFRRTPMSCCEAGVLYRSCFIPALSYPLRLCWLPGYWTHSLQKSTVYLRQ